ncbi:DUF4132 domain-containing protein [Catenuloplanes japonicus]|uniref:DUF4132 domain-containing protein n=1 Tax=Catenuloplanes japonicus TaxID=33876 RepID=UPI000526811B|nr:DUF4132 domain-containing protein [Catenuloplanes japonicus]
MRSTPLLPEVAEPPPRAKAIRVPGLVCHDPPGETWLPGERDRWRALAPDTMDTRTFAEWDPPPGARTEPEQSVVARFGLDVLPSALRIAARHPDRMGVLLLPFHTPDLAGTVAGWLTRAGSARLWARLWLDRHPEPAARALIPPALARAKPHRDNAIAGLHMLDRLGHRTVIDKAAAEYGVDALPSFGIEVSVPQRALIPWVLAETLPPIRLRADGTALPVEDVRTLLDALTYTRFGALAEPAPGHYDPATGRATPVDSAAAPQPPPATDTPGTPVIEAARRLCDARDLARFGAALLERWVAASLPPQESWILLAQAHLADADTTASLGAEIRTWPGSRRFARAGEGIAVLCALAGREWGPVARAALWELHQLSGLHAATVRDRVPVCLAQAAAVHGLTAAQVPFRAGPVDLGLGEDGRTALDYGPRQVIVGVDDGLEAYVAEVLPRVDASGLMSRPARDASDSPGDAVGGAADETPRAVGGVRGVPTGPAPVLSVPAGAVSRTLPRSTTRDDPAAVATARARWTRLRKDLRTETARHVAYLEQALIAGTRWPAAELTRLTRHPLLGPLSRRLLWASYPPSAPPRMLRVCEDGSLADLDERPATLHPSTQIALAHPAEIGPDLARWSELFTDYKILQPFPQLGRERFPLTAAELAAPELTRVIGRPVDLGRKRTLQRHGWYEDVRSGLPFGAFRLIRRLPADLIFVLDIASSHITDAYPEESGTLHWRRPHHLPLSTLAPITLDEVIREITTLTSL